MYITRPNVALCFYYLSFTVYDVSARELECLFCMADHWASWAELGFCNFPQPRASVGGLLDILLIHSYFHLPPINQKISVFSYLTFCDMDRHIPLNVGFGKGHWMEDIWVLVLHCYGKD